MPHPRSNPTSALVALFSLASALSLSAQGPLLPPGAPAPSLKSLAQIEPRTDVTTLTGDGTCIHLISQPGSYYLPGNVSGLPGRVGIVIASSNVTLDLGGFSLTGVTGSTVGLEIRAPAAANVTVRRGSITGFDSDGLRFPAALANVFFEDLRISACGGSGIAATAGAALKATARGCRIHDVKAYGINFGGGGTVADCSVSQLANGSFAVGLFAFRIQNCSVDDVSSTSASAAGIYGENVLGCTVNNVVSSTGTAIGIGATTVTDCQVNAVRGGGSLPVFAINGTTVARCSVTQIGTFGGGLPTGIGGSVVSQCTVSSVGGAGSTGEVTGILAGVITQCLVTGLGQAALNQPVSGITATYGGIVSDCAVTYLFNGQGALRGINGKNVSRCRVTNLTQAGAAAGPSGYAAGIEAEAIVDCSVTALSGNHSTGARGLSGFRSASGCQVSAITDGVGFARGMLSLLPAVVDRCTVVGGRQGLLLSGDGSRVSHSNFSDIPNIAPGTGYGVAVYGNNTRIEHCNFTNVGDAGVWVLANSAVVDANSFATGTRAVLMDNAGKALITRNRLASDILTLVSGGGLVQTGPLISATGDLASTHPWANFRH